MNIKYIELKTGYNDDGPAWIGNIKESKIGKTVYFNDHAFQRCSSRGVTGIGGNYYDIETGEEYWMLAKSLFTGGYPVLPPVIFIA